MMGVPEERCPDLAWIEKLLNHLGMNQDPESLRAAFRAMGTILDTAQFESEVFQCSLAEAILSVAKTAWKGYSKIKDNPAAGASASNAMLFVARLVIETTKSNVKE